MNARTVQQETQTWKKRYFEYKKSIEGNTDSRQQHKERQESLKTNATLKAAIQPTQEQYKKKNKREKSDLLSEG